MPEPHDFRIRPLDALRALGESFRDPDDTVAVVRIIDAIAGKSGLRMLDRFAALPGSKAILERERCIREVLEDRDALAAMPSGSLGRSYYEFTRREQITAEGLVEASREAMGAERADEPENLYGWYMERFRDTHDLWHVLTGYGRDLLGEAGLLSFTYAQSRHYGFGFIAAAVYLRTLLPGSPNPELDQPGIGPRARAIIREGRRRGRAAEWLPGQDWEALLPEPLEAVRQRLAIPELAAYEPVRTLAAPALGT